MSENNAFLGAGGSFPPQFNNPGNGISLVDGELDIKQSLHILLSTHPGERVMNPDYGCGIKAMVFDEINLSTVTQMKSLINKSVLFFEPRINLHSVDIDQRDSLEGTLYITLDYTVITTNSRANLVYPFYIMEGTLVSL
ncbi:MAG: GPW/gp25 family protein [Psychrosphaera sp.]|nr:GPW/gp25 family protein [Psychrosphaera sp.]